MYEHDKDGEKMAIFGFYEEASLHKIPDGGDDDDDGGGDKMFIT